MKTTPHARLPRGMFRGQDAPGADGRYRENAPRERRPSLRIPVWRQMKGNGRFPLDE